ncbi:MAG TPA: DUF5702 domain-containing protein, partial [Anaerovoracaceae bacterium]|nr:DUF5702 domain-containing protein [Anaerovoracaceae bacterium]
MRHILHSKRGTTSVFLTMILASILLLVGLFIHAASQAAGKSCADAVFDLAGRSVLSEYDLQLQKRYGIFAVRTDEKQAEEKIKFYADYSFHDNALKEALRFRGHTDALKLKLQSVDVSLKGYSITDVSLFEGQVLEHMKYDILKDVFPVDTAYPPISEPSAADPDAEYPASGREIVLRNGQIISGLPSNGYGSNLWGDLKRIVEGGVPNLGEIERSSRNTFLADEYIIRHFLNHRRGKEVRDTFFRNEVEYVLKGNFSDSRNYSAVRTDLFIMRNVLNLAHIFGDPEKRKDVETIAAALTLVRGKEIGAAVVAEAWAAAETENDLRLLEAGKEVAFVKGGDNWAVPLSDSLEYLWNDGYISPKRTSGYDYEDYLRVLLFLENREQKLLRCMDLIQL